MRKGQNPYRTTNSKIKPPEKVTVGMAVHIPSLTGYYSEMLEILKLSIDSLLNSTNIPFDFLVIDNDSCKEVKLYLNKLFEDRLIDYLILNKRNIGKPNAAMMILEGARGEIIVVSDCDILYEKGWLEAYLEILNAFPNVGLIGGYPCKNFVHQYTKSTFEWVNNNQDKIIIEKGNLTEKKWIVEYLESIGNADPEKIYEEKWQSIDDYKITYKDVSAFVGATHMQFLTLKKYIKTFPQFIFDDAIGVSENVIDQELDNQKLIRLSTHKPFVKHLGNRIKNDNKRRNNLHTEKYVKSTKKYRRYLKWFKKLTLDILININKILIGLIDSIKSK